MATTPLHLSLHSRQTWDCHPRLLKPSLTDNPQCLPAGPHPLSPKVTIPQFHPGQTTAPLSDETTMSPKCSSTCLTICTSMQHTPRTLLPTPCNPRTPPAMSWATPIPVPHQSSSPPPVPAPSQSPSHHIWQMSTLWDHYIQTQGFQIHNPLYYSPVPCHHIKKLLISAECT